MVLRRRSGRLKEQTWQAFRTVGQQERRRGDVHFHSPHSLGLTKANSSGDSGASRLKPVLPKLVEHHGLQLPFLLLPTHELQPCGAADLAGAPGGLDAPRRPVAPPLLHVAPSLAEAPPAGRDGGHGCTLQLRLAGRGGKGGHLARAPRLRERRPPGTGPRGPQPLGARCRRCHRPPRQCEAVGRAASATDPGAAGARAGLKAISKARPRAPLRPAGQGR